MAKIVAMVSMYESGVWIENRLNNLIGSTIFNDIEIWCVNADSPDNRDHDIPLAYSQKYSNIIYKRLESRINVYATWNYIIQNSTSDYITNANTDDIVSPDCYRILSSFLDSNQNYDFVYPSWLTTARENQTWPPKEVDNGGAPGQFTGDIDRAGAGHFPMWRRSLHNNLGYFDDSFGALADADWWMRCSHVGKSKFYWLNDHLACYLWRDGSNGRSRNLWHRAITGEEWAKFHTKAAKYRNGEL